MKRLRYNKALEQRQENPLNIFPIVISILKLNPIHQICVEFYSVSGTKVLCVWQMNDMDLTVFALKVIEVW